MNNTPFTKPGKNQSHLEICKPYQNEYGIIYFLKGEDLQYEFEDLYVMNLEENKYDTNDKICIMLDDEQKISMDIILEKIKKKLALQLRMKEFDSRLSTVVKESKLMNIRLNKKQLDSKANLIGKKHKMIIAFDSLFVNNNEQHYIRPRLIRVE